MVAEPDYFAEKNQKMELLLCFAFGAGPHIFFTNILVPDIRQSLGLK